MSANPQLSDLYDKMTTECNGEFGIFIPASTFDRHALDGLDRATKGVVSRGGLDIPARGAAMSPQLPTGSKPTMTVSLVGSSVLLKSSPFIIDVVLHRKNNLGDELSSIRFEFLQFVLKLVPRSNDLAFDVVQSQLSAPVITPGANRDGVIASLGWSADEKATFEQFEQFAAFTGKGTFVPLLAGLIAPPPLVTAFPGVRLNPISISPLVATDVGEGVLVTSKAATSLLPPDCGPCGGGQQEFETGISGSAASRTYPLSLTIAGRSNPPKAAQNLERIPNQGLSLYVLIPEKLASLSFGPQAFPAIAIGDGGSFAGFEYRWDAVVSFESFNLSVDTTNPALLIDANCRFSLDASAWINLPCDGRVDVGSGTVTGGIDNLNIRVNILFDERSQEIRFDSVLENHNVKDLQANITLFGFPIDQILDLVVAHNAPGMISEQLRDAVSRGRFVLGDFSRIVPSLGLRFRTSTFFAKATGTLFGVYTVAD